MADVFISYKREDKARVAAIAAALEEEGFSVWWDPEIPLGESYAVSIRRELEAATSVVAVWSAASVQSEWVQEEATLAKRKGALVPARIDAVDPPVGFTMTQTADLTGWAGDRADGEWRRLVEHVAENAKRPAKPIPQGYRAPAPGKRGRTLPWVLGAVAAAVLAAGAFLAINLVTRPASESAATATEAAPIALAEVPLLGQAMTFRSPSGGFSTAALSPDGRIVATGDAQGAIRLYDASNALPLGGVERAHAGAISHLAWAGDAILVSAGADRRIRIADVNAPEAEPRIVETPRPATALATAPASGEIVYADREGGLYNALSPSTDTDYRVPDRNYAVTLSVDASGGAYVIGSSAGWAYYYADSETEPAPLHMPGAGAVRAVLLPDGERVAAGTYRRAAIGAATQWGDAIVLVAPGYDPTAMEGATTAIATTADGRLLAHAIDGGSIFVWDVPSRRLIGRIETVESRSYLAFTPDGRRLLAATAEGEAGMYDLPAP